MRPSAGHMSSSEVTPPQTLIPNRSLTLKSWKTPLQEARRQCFAARFSQASCSFAWSQEGRRMVPR